MSLVKLVKLENDTKCSACGKTIKAIEAVVQMVDQEEGNQLLTTNDISCKYLCACGEYQSNSFWAMFFHIMFHGDWD